ncbi:GatB/YqeY domain-containing protein [Bartonella sp. B41]
MLRDQIDMALKVALQVQDKARVSTLRLIDVTIRDRDILYRNEGKMGVDDFRVQSVLAKMIEQREKQVCIYKESGRLELAEKEQEEIEIILEFLPHQFDELEVEQALYEALMQTRAKGLRDVGKVMAWLKENYAGQINFSKVSRSLREKLQRILPNYLKGI